MPTDNSVSEFIKNFLENTSTVSPVYQQLDTMSEEDQKHVRDLKEHNLKIIRTVVEKAKRQNAVPPYEVEMTPVQFGMMRRAIVVKSPDHNVTHVVIGPEAWACLATNPAFISLIDPTSRYVDTLGGKMATVLGSEAITDAFFHPDERVLDPNFFALVCVKDGEVLDFVAAHI